VLAEGRGTAAVQKNREGQASDSYERGKRRGGTVAQRGKELSSSGRGPVVSNKYLVRDPEGR